MAHPSRLARSRGDLAITFVPGERGPAQLLPRPEIHSLDDGMAGLCLRGFSVWSGDSEPDLTFPRSGSGYQLLRARDTSC